MRFIPIVLALVTLTSCEHLKEAGKAGAAIVVDCTKEETARVVDELGPVVDHIFSQATDPTGKVNWSPIRDLASRFTTEVGGCVLADVVARALKPTEPGGVQSSPLQVDLVDLRAGFTALKAERFSGVTFKTSAGVL
jgi:hypothetical protein